MQSICVKNDEGKYILLTMNPEEGDFVIKKNIEKFVPIMKTHCNKLIILMILIFMMEILTLKIQV